MLPNPPPSTEGGTDIESETEAKAYRAYVGRHLLHRVHHGQDARERARARSYKKALRVKLKPLLSSNLTSDGVKANAPFDFGKSKREYTTRRSASDAVIKVLMAVIFGYFGVSLASEVNVASSFMWVVDDYRGSVIKKIDYLQKFKNYCGAFKKTE